MTAHPTAPLPDLQALHSACQGKSLARVKALLEQGADARALDARGRGPLHALANRFMNGASPVPLLKLLVHHGALVDPADRDGITPLGLAVANGNAPLVSALLALGANPNTPGENGERPLGQAVNQGMPATVRALLDAGADVHAIDALGWTAMHHAAHSATVMSATGTAAVLTCVDQLIAAGASVSVPSVTEATGNPPETPLQLTLRRNSPEVAARLLSAGALKGLGLRPRQDLVEQGLAREVWSTLDVLIAHGAAQGVRSRRLEQWLDRVPPQGTSHRCLESLVLGGTVSAAPANAPAPGHVRPRL